MRTRRMITWRMRTRSIRTRRMRDKEDIVNEDKMADEPRIKLTTLE